MAFEMDGSSYLHLSASVARGSSASGLREAVSDVAKRAPTLPRDAPTGSGHVVGDIAELSVVKEEGPRRGFSAGSAVFIVVLLLMLGLACAVGTLYFIWQSPKGNFDSERDRRSVERSPGQSARSPVPESPGRPFLESPRGLARAAPEASPAPQLAARFTSDNLHPSLKDSVVRPNQHFVMTVPSLLKVPRTKEVSQKASVLADSGKELFSVGVLRFKAPGQPDEYVEIRRADDDQVLACCVFPPGISNEKCWIVPHQGETPSLCVKADFREETGSSRFALVTMEDPEQQLFVLEVKGRVADRKCEVIQHHPHKVLARRQPRAREVDNYDMECLVGSDPLLVLVALLCADRFALAGGYAW